MDRLQLRQPISLRCLGHRRYLSSRDNNEVTLVEKRKAWERWELHSAIDPESTAPLLSGAELKVVSLQWRKLLTARRAVWQYAESPQHAPYQRWRLVAGDDATPLAVGAEARLVPLSCDPPRAVPVFASGRSVLEIQFVETPDDWATWVLERC